MVWEGKSLGEICRQLKDVQLYGGRDLAGLQEHIAKDDLVAWAWKSGGGSQARSGQPGSCGKVGAGLDRQRSGVPPLVTLSLLQSSD